MDENEVNCFYDNYYFRLNKKLQIYSGIWPYESRLKKLVPQILLYIVVFTAQIPLFNACRIWCGIDLDVCGENIVGIAYSLTIVSKLWVTFFSEQQLKNIYQRIAKNWVQIADAEEHAILMEYARQGRIKSIGYLVFMTLAGMSFSQMPMIPVILDFLFPLNESRPEIPFVKGEFIFDRTQHFYKLYIFFMIAAVITVLAMTSIDTTFTVIVHQILAIFSIVKHRLRLATVSFDLFNDIGYHIIIKTIHLHKEALHFIDLIEASYRSFFLIVIGNTVVFVTMGVVLVTEQNSVLDLCRFMMILSAAILHFLYISWPGQKILDHSNEVFTSSYTNEWYNTSEKSKKLLKFLMLRSSKPSSFTARGLYIMNLENFGSIMKSAVSYVAVIGSFR